MAQAHKAKGNTAFKAGDWAAAVGHYSAAIFADRADPTFPLNRAAAYLKLGKNDDAERDCSTVLQLKPGHVKALFRRGQARAVLNRLKEAEQDFLEALRLEPANELVKQELAKLQIAVAPRRRRVSIELLFPMNELGSVPVSSRFTETQLKAHPIPTSISSDSPQRVDRPTRKVGGGIFRPSGDHTIFHHLDFPSEPSATPSGPTLPPDNQTKLPMTLFNFTRAWSTLTTALERWELLACISPEKLPVLFRASLDPALLNSILATFLAVLPNNIELKPAISRYMRAFASVPRFSTVTLFFTTDEQKSVRTLWDLLGERPKWGV